MHGSIAKAATASIASLALLASPSGCKAESGGTTGVSKDGICRIDDVRAPETLMVPGANEPWVQGVLRISCNPSPRDMRTLLTLERKNPETGNWNKLQIGPPDLATPDTYGHTFTVSAGWCEPGLWRMTVKITGSTPNGTPFEVKAPTRTSKITC